MSEYSTAAGRPFPYVELDVGDHRHRVSVEAVEHIRAEAAAAARTALLDELETAVKGLPATMWPDFEGIDEEVPYVTFEGVRRTAVLHEITRRRHDPRG